MDGVEKRLNDDGTEKHDDRPVALPIRFKRAETLTETVRRLISSELSGLAMNQGFESFDEADDFDVGDDYDPRSPHELDDHQSEYDIRHDPRYERRPAADEVVASEGGGEAEQKLQARRMVAKFGKSFIY